MGRPAAFSLAMPVALCLAGCPATAPVAVPQAPPVPESRYVLASIDGRRGVAAWRPRASEHVLALDGQRCAFVDLQLRCVPPPTPAQTRTQAR